MILAQLAVVSELFAGGADVISFNTGTVNKAHADDITNYDTGDITYTYYMVTTILGTLPTTMVSICRCCAYTGDITDDDGEHM